MLRKKLQYIKTREERYQCACWKYNFSGQYLELSILPAHLKDREKYRCAVIHIGQVIEALRVEIEKAGYRYHIQSFPNLEDAGLVASIRLEKKGEQFFQKSDKDTSETIDLEATQNTFAKISKLADHQELVLANNETGEIELPELPVETQDREVFTLLSKYDNPFSWLRVGYWKESTLRKLTADNGSDRFLLFDFCREIDRKLFYTKYSDTHFIQGLVIIQRKQSKTAI